MEYDPTVAGDMISAYPELARYEEFSEPVEVAPEVLDQILRYTMLWLDEESPFYKERDLEYKSSQCMKYAGCKTEAKNCIAKYSQDYRRCLLRYMKLCNNYRFEEWLSLKLDFHENTAYLSASLSSTPDPEKAIERKIKIKTNRQADLERLLQIEDSLFKDDKTRKAVTKAANEAGLVGFAEKYAENFFEQ